MPFKVFKTLFPKQAVASLHATKTIHLYKKAFNMLHVAQSGVCTVGLRHKDKKMLNVGPGVTSTARDARH